ncbi:MAG TPA: hypothetical protein VFD49_02985 [Candidatus Dormibacteraeota bacterium]|nr:hypothetical protein [Candidatus Dormibacteraeota bacterium]
MDGPTFAWALARVCGLAAFTALSISLLTGLGLRTGVLDWLGSNRELRALHEYATVLWAPLGGLHVLALLLDTTARVGLTDLLVPFRMPYGTLAIGLGTLSLQTYLLVGVTGWLRRRMGARAWRWAHRLSYPAFGLLFGHGLLAGTDWGDPVISTLAWATAGLLLLLTVARMVWGRLP